MQFATVIGKLPVELTRMRSPNWENSYLIHNFTVYAQERKKWFKICMTAIWIVEVFFIWFWTQIVSVMLVDNYQHEFYPCWLMYCPYCGMNELYLYTNWLLYHLVDMICIQISHFGYANMICLFPVESHNTKDSFEKPVFCSLAFLFWFFSIKNYLIEAKIPFIGEFMKNF